MTFTYETEKENKLAFLDVLVTREGEGGGGGHSAHLYTVNPLLVDYIGILKVLCLILIKRGWYLHFSIERLFFAVVGTNSIQRSAFSKIFFEKINFPKNLRTIVLRFFWIRFSFPNRSLLQYLNRSLVQYLNRSLLTTVPKQIITTVPKQIITTVPKEIWTLNFGIKFRIFVNKKCKI